MPISQSSRNILSSPGHSATITVRAHPARASNARVALMGNVTVFDGGHALPEEEAKELADCFTKRHPDAKWWLPGRKPAPHLVSLELFHTLIPCHIFGAFESLTIRMIPGRDQSGLLGAVRSPRKFCPWNARTAFSPN